MVIGIGGDGYVLYGDKIVIFVFFLFDCINVCCLFNMLKMNIGCSLKYCLFELNNVFICLLFCIEIV